MLAAGAKNELVRWSSAQAIVLWCAWLVVWILFSLAGLARVGEPHWPYAVIDLAFVAGWLWATTGAFAGKTVRLPVVAPLTRRLFGSML